MTTCYLGTLPYAGDNVVSPGNIFVLRGEYCERKNAAVDFIAKTRLRTK